MAEAPGGANLPFDAPGATNRPFDASAATNRPSDAPGAANPPFDALVVGAGWAGLAAAIELTDRGLRVAVADAAPAPGGRAREIRLDLGFGPVALDNGQHLLIGAYRETLRAIARVHPPGAAPFSRHPLELRDTAGLRIAAWPLPAPLHLLGALAGARGLSLADRAAAVRLMAALRAAGWRARDGETVAALFARTRQTPRLVDRLWDPLCTGALNTAPGEACAQTFARVLQDSLGAARSDSDFVLPAGTLGELFPEPAARWLDAHGAALRRGFPVRALEREDRGWVAHGPGAAIRARQLVLAIPPFAAARLLEPLGADAGPLHAFSSDSIATVWLAWPQAAAPALPRWIMLREERERGAFGQWLFDRGVQRGHRIASVVISAHGRNAVSAGAQGAAIAAPVAAQAAAQLRLAQPAFAKTVVEKRATFRCAPDRPRLRADHFAGELPGLWIAGDHAWPDYPATLEAAVRSGIEAARLAAQRQAASSA